MKHFESFQISDELKKDILVNLVEPTYKSDIKINLNLKKKFKFFGLTFETLSKLFVGFSSIASFAAGIYKYEIISFVAGTTSVISLVLLQYSSFSYHESKKISNELNSMLKKLNIESINTDNISETFTPDGPVTPKEVKLPRISTIRTN